MLFKGKNTKGYIGGASMRAMAWAERTALSLNPQAERVARGPAMRTLTQTGDFSELHQNLNTSSTGVWGVLSYDLPYRQPANRYPRSMSAPSIENHPDDRTILPAPAQNTNTPYDLQGRKAQGRTGDKRTAKILSGKSSETNPYINVGKVADRVYNLMQHDLILERERTTRLRG
jgi:hypothetical protein